MKQQTLKVFLVLSLSGLYFNTADAQQNSKDFFKYRSNNIVMIGAGLASPNLDFPEPEFDIDLYIGYERYLWPHLSVQLLYHKYNLTTVGKFSEGFMSFDLNFKSLLIPYNRISPFLQAGGGLNASNYFLDDWFKIQLGGGFEIVLSRGFSLVLYADYNYVLADDLEGFEAGDANDSFIRAGLGFNFYFGFGKDRNLEGKKTIINSNPIKHEY